MRRLAGVCFAVVVLTVGGCAIEPEDSPQSVDLTIPPSPLDLSPTASDQSPATVYFVSDGGGLVPVRRDVDADGSPAQRLAATLEALVAGPTEAEVDAGTSSAVPVTTEILSVSIESGSALIDLSATFLSIGGAAEILAVGQVVVTATTQPGVQRVALSIEGERVAIPLPDGALRETAVELSEYVALLAPGQPAPPNSGTTTLPDPGEENGDPTAPDGGATSTSTTASTAVTAATGDTGGP